jgi:hypothetical protein
MFYFTYKHMSTPFPLSIPPKTLTLILLSLAIFHHSNLATITQFLIICITPQPKPILFLLTPLKQ